MYPLITTLFVYIIIESIWLFVMRSFYKGELSKFSKDGRLLIRSKTAVILLYPILFACFYYFVLRHVRKDTSVTRVLISGVLFGLVIYGIYNLTNKATLLGYTWNMTVIDILWGVICFGLLSVIYFYSY